MADKSTVSFALICGLSIAIYVESTHSNPLTINHTYPINNITNTTKYPSDEATSPPSFPVIADIATNTANITIAIKLIPTIINGTINFNNILPVTHHALPKSLNVYLKNSKALSVSFLFNLNKFFK